MNSELVERRDHLRRAIDVDRARLRKAVRNLQEVVKERTDLRQRIADRPYHWMGGALVVGLLLGARRT